MIVDLFKKGKTGYGIRVPTNPIFNKFKMLSPEDQAILNIKFKELQKANKSKKLQKEK